MIVLGMLSVKLSLSMLKSVMNLVGQARVFLPSDNCNVLSNKDQCKNCKSLKAKDAQEAKPIPSKAGLTATGKESLVATI